MKIRIKLAKTSDNPMRALKLVKHKCDRYNISGEWSGGQSYRGNEVLEHYFTLETDVELDEMHRKLLYAFIDFVIHSNPSLEGWKTAKVSNDETELL